MAIFIGRDGATDIANAVTGVLIGFTPNDVAALQDSIGDVFVCGSGDDFVFAGDGDDVIEGNTGRDTLNGGGGNDTIFANEHTNINGSLIGVAEINGWFGNDVLWGSGGNDLLVGHNGEDSLRGQSGNDTLDGGNDNDVIDADDGNDLLIGGFGEDTLFGNIGDDLILGGDGLDVISGNDGNDTIDGGFDVDTMDGGAGIDTNDVRFWDFGYAWNMTTGATNFAGETAVNFENGLMGAGDDSITGTSGANLIDGGAGNDMLAGGNGNDTLVGGDGNDTIEGGFNADIVSGGDGNDLIFAMTQVNPGSSGVADILNGDAGNDTMTGSGGNDRLNGGAGIDRLFGGFGDDSYFVNAANEASEAGGGGIDTVRSIVSYALGADLENLVLLGGGNTNATGNALGNRIIGNVGNNTLTGDLGRDVMTGGVGFDRFDFNNVVESGLTAAARDVITDFDAGSSVGTIDRIDVQTIDANTGILGDQQFIFGGPFTAGHIQAVQSGANVLLRFNTDGDAAAEMTILLNNVLAGNFGSGDFVL